MSPAGRMLFSAALLAALAPGAARAEPSPAEASVEARVDATAPEPVSHYTIPTPGSPNGTRSGGASVVVHAPIDVVRRVVTDFARYRELLPGIDRLHVIGRRRHAADLYLHAPILHGSAEIWALVRFRWTKTAGGEEAIVGEYLDGNLAGLRFVLHLVPVGVDRTAVRLDLLVEPKLPVPSSAVTDGAARVAGIIVARSRDRAETVAERLRVATN